MTTLQGQYVCGARIQASGRGYREGGEPWESLGLVFPGASQDTTPSGYFSLICKEGEKEEWEETRRKKERKLKALNLARCDIPQNNNTASSRCWWKTEDQRWEMYILQSKVPAKAQTVGH